MRAASVTKGSWGCREGQHLDGRQPVLEAGVRSEGSRGCAGSLALLWTFPGRSSSAPLFPPGLPPSASRRPHSSQRNSGGRVQFWGEV